MRWTVKAAGDAAVISMTDEDYAPRYCSDRLLGGMVHDYLKIELADPTVVWLIPRCQEGTMLPGRHDVANQASLPGLTEAVAPSARVRSVRVVQTPTRSGAPGAIRSVQGAAMERSASTTWDWFRNSGGWPIETDIEEAERAAGPHTGSASNDTPTDRNWSGP